MQATDVHWPPVCKFYAPNLKGPLTASSGLSICPSVCLLVGWLYWGLSKILFHLHYVQYFKLWWSYSNQTWTVYLRVPHTSLTSHALWDGAESNWRTDFVVRPLQIYQRVCWLYWGFTSAIIIAAWKQEIANPWKFKWRGRESNPGPLAPQAKSLTTLPPLLPLYQRDSCFTNTCLLGVSQYIGLTIYRNARRIYIVSQYKICIAIYHCFSFF